jgi:hypothetical protein
VRLRQANITYDNSGWGFHFLAGQAWSLLTQNQVGITPRKENIPITIDANYVVGWNYVRQWQIRAVQEFGPGVSLGVSIENSATIFGGSIATAPTGVGGAFASGGIVDGVVVNFANIAGGGGFLNGVTVTTDHYPTSSRRPRSIPAGVIMKYSACSDSSRTTPSLASQARAWPARP